MSRNPLVDEDGRFDAQVAAGSNPGTIARRTTRPLQHLHLILPALAVTAAIMSVLVLPPWIRVITPRWMVRWATIAFLEAVFFLLCVSIPTFALGLLASIAALVRSRIKRRPCSAPGRWALLCSSVLVALAATEFCTAALRQQRYRLADLPTKFTGRPDRGPPIDFTAAVPPVAPHPRATPAGDGVERRVSIVVVGESSARGEPYHPWVSVGQIVAWQLQRVLPGVEFRVEILAEGGLCLEQAIHVLGGLRHRPDALIVFAGHNEFQGRFGWSRNSRHYVEEGPDSPLALVELARSASATAELILENLDRFRGEERPPKRVTRELVDHPTCTAETRGFLRREFERRLDGLASWCVREGILPILIVPASNDGGFDPSRSVLDGSTPLPRRTEFADLVRAARAAESSDPQSAIAAYRGLIERHPEFAETHYRLGRLLHQVGGAREAREHFVQARDLDGLPLRCPSEFQQTIRAVAARWDGLLVDGSRVLEQLSPDGILDDRLFHDAHHMNLVGQAALARDILTQLRSRRAFGWPDPVPVPEIDLADCVRSFDLDRVRWAEICRRSAEFYSRTAFVRFDPADRLAAGERYERAAEAIVAGTPIDQTGVESLISVSKAMRIPR
jgi:hypothetical protein